jgi:DNA (cytosine-5)-methyltransferase 1
VKSIFVDLFAGIGGFALGAYWAGLRFDEHYYSEIDKCACEVYQARFPEAINLGDIKKIDCKKLPEGEYILAGGFPCQDISLMGHMKGIEGERSGLYKHYIRVIRELRPRFAVMENVSSLTVLGMGRLLGELSDLGYDAEWTIISAAEVGAPHVRKRIWLVAYPYGQRQQAFGKENKNIENCYFKKPHEWELLQSIVTRNYTIEHWENFESIICRDDDGVSERVDRYKVLGNAIVPQIAQVIFEGEIFDKWRCAECSR